MTDEHTPKVLLDRNPELPAIMKAIEEFKANKPVTQRCSKTGEPMVVKEDQELGVLIVTCGKRIVYRSRRRFEILSPQRKNSGMDASAQSGLEVPESK